LATAFLALSVTVLLVASGSQIFFNIQAQQEAVASGQQLIAQEAANTVASFVEGKFGELEAAVRLGRPTSVAQEEQRNILSGLLGLDLAFRRLALLDSQEQELATASRLSQAAPGQLTDRVEGDVFAQVRQGNRYIGPVYIDDVTGEPMVIMVVPAADAFGEVQGTLLAEVNLKFMWDLVDRLEIGEAGLAYVVDRQGNLIAFGDISRVLRGENVGQLKEVGEFVGSPALFDETGAGISQGINGSTIVGTYVPLGTPDWAVVTELPLTEAYGPVIRSTAISVLVLLVVATLAGLLGVYIARRLAAPLLNLTAAAGRIAGGEVGVQAAVEGPAEVASLAGAFNNMTGRLRELITGLEDRTRELEASQRVTFAASERVTPDELLDLVVNLIRDQFDLYHAQVYIVDEAEGAAILRQSTGYAGRQLLQRKHKIPLDATALVTKAIHTGESVLVADVTQDPNFLANPLLPDTRSELVVPLKLSGKVIGVLDAQDRTPGRFGTSTVNLFESMADQVAILFENSNLLTRITEQTETLTVFTTQLRTAAGIARRLGAILDPEQLLEQVVELLQSRFGLYHAHIYVVDEASRRLVIRAGSGEVGRVLRKRGHAIPLDTEKSMVARAARERETVLVNDTSLESDFLPNPLLPQTRSEVAIPLFVGDKTLGVLDVQDDQVNRFSQADVDTFNTLAGQIATALQTADTYEQTRLRLSASQALAGAKTEEEVLNVLIQQAGLYPKTQVSIFMIEEEGDERYVVARGAQSFGSRLPASVQPGLRFPLSQFPLIEQAGIDGLFVSANFPIDERADSFAREMSKQTGVVSLTVVPITVGGEQLGSISVSSEEEGYFDKRKLNLYQTLAEQGATALRIARLNDEVQQSLSETQMRFAISQALAGAETEEEVLDVLVQQARLYPTAQVSIYMFDHAAEELTIVARRVEAFDSGIESMVPVDMRFLASQFPMLNQNISPDAPLVTPNLLRDERMDPAIREMLSQMGLVSFAALPITAGTEWLGVMAVSSKEEGYFDERKQNLYRTLVEQGATALRTARLYDETQKTAERLAEVDRLKSEFLASMSHELRTPLNSIIGYTEIMLMGIDTELDPELREDVQAIYDNGRHLLNIINDVLDLAKIEAGRLGLNMEKVPIQSVVDAAASSVAGLLVNKSIEFNIEAEQDLPTIWGDQVRISQVLNNLLSNAIKFTDEGHVTLRAFSDDGWVCLEVEDTGVGIGEADQEKLFERFQQIDGSNARRKEGTGLGLAISRHLVSLHGGTLTVNSKLGEGSTFIVRLPIHAGAAGGAAPAQVEAAAPVVLEEAIPAGESEGIEEALAEAERLAEDGIAEAALAEALAGKRKSPPARAKKA
jgi:signal transduction histidine kinase/putative methionine-R-sulfoxide reductase with GAF domain